MAFLMDTGAECNILSLDVCKEVTGDLDLNFLDTRAKSVLILANGCEQPIEEGKATLYVTRKGDTHKIQVNVFKGRGYEPILSKETMLEMHLVKILGVATVQSLRRFLGMVNCLVNFLPRLSDETEVLRKLTKRKLNDAGYLPMLLPWPVSRK